MQPVIESKLTLVGPLPWGSGGQDKSKKPVNNHKGKDGSMKRLSIVSLALVALVGSAVGLSAAESGTFTGTAASSGTYKRPQSFVDGKRYELKASDKADASVAEVLARFSKGDTGMYVVKGARGTVNGVDGIHIDSTTQAGRVGTGPPRLPGEVRAPGCTPAGGFSCARFCPADSFTPRGRARPEQGRGTWGSQPGL
jgi:hypothetical protein